MTRQLEAWGGIPKGEIRRFSRKHIFTHVEWHMRVYAFEVAPFSLPEGWEWANTESAHALPTAFRICLTD